MRLSDFDFPFDETLIADRPADPRDHARLLVVRRDSQNLEHRRVDDLPALLDPGDLLVVNDTKVLRARVAGRKSPSGGRADLLFVREVENGLWEVLVKGNVRSGQVIELGCESTATVVDHAEGRTTVRVSGPCSVAELMTKVGLIPLPPYIKREPCEADHRWYQTVFAGEAGAVAAPTAGLHLTDDLLKTLRERGVRLARLTLHVGPGTFRPVRVEEVAEHRMGFERFHISGATAEAVRRTRADRRKVVAVGTTVVRTLEAAADARGGIRPMDGETDLYILPGYQFGVVDALMTNFHLPRTTLLMLVSAFGGTELLREAYREAIRGRYRFYSYGDAMLIL